MSLKIAIIAPDGAGLRNFVIGPFLQRFPGEAIVLSGCPDEALERLTKGTPAKANWLPMAPLREFPVPFTLRQMLSYAHVYCADTHSMRYTRSRRTGGSWKTKAANHTARAIGRMAAFPAGVRAIEAAYFAAASRVPEISYYRKLFEESKPRLLMSTSQQAPRVLPAVLAAQSLGIPTVAFVASWDNLTSKGRIAAPFDDYMVWSDHMRKELLRFYPHVAPERVHVVGTPQFDCYAETAFEWTREQFFSKIGADPNRPLICYSGGDEGTCPDDQHHVRILMEQIRTGEIPGKPQVVVRPSPVDPCDRYESVLRDYPEMLFARPEWYHPKSGPWSLCVPYAEDIQFLSNLTRHTDMNVNVASTMTLDFALRDKPVVNIAFDVTYPPPARVPLWDLFYSWEHYEPVVKFGAAKFSRSAPQMAQHVSEYLQDTSQDREGRRKLVNLQVGVPLGESSTTIYRLLQKIAA